MLYLLILSLSSSKSILLFTLSCILSPTEKQYIINTKSPKKKLMILAVAAFAVLASCTDKKAAQSVADKDSTSVAGYTVSEEDNLDLTSVADTYEGTFPAADGPGIKTKPTIKADSTYQLVQDYVDRKDGHDETSGVLKS